MRLLFALLLLSIVFAVQRSVLTATELSPSGPIVLLGIDAEDGGLDGHGPRETYLNIVNGLLAEVSNGEARILVIGSGKNQGGGIDNVTEFWTYIGQNANLSAASTALSDRLDMVNGPEEIRDVHLTHFAMIAIASSDDPHGTPSGGLTNAENEALRTRARDLAEFVRTGGGLLGLSQLGLDAPYAYLNKMADIQSASVGSGYDDVDPTIAGEDAGVSEPYLDVCCWHDVFTQHPDGFQILAVNDDPLSTYIGESAAIARYECPSSQLADDSDGDTLSNLSELTIVGTDPCSPDTDGDDLLDSWECGAYSICGFDLDGDGIPDDINDDGVVDVQDRDEVFGPYGFNPNSSLPPGYPPAVASDRRVEDYSGAFPPNPLKKDVYLEFDWLDCDLGGDCPGEFPVVLLTLPPTIVNMRFDPTHHAPDPSALWDVRFRLAQAPILSPDQIPADNPSSGINFHFLIDEAIPHSPNCDQGESLAYEDYFATEELREPENAQALSARQLVYRYVWSGHSSVRDNGSNCTAPSDFNFFSSALGEARLPDYDYSPFGASTLRGRDMLVTLGPLWICESIEWYEECFRDPVAGIFPAEVNGVSGEFRLPMNRQLGTQPKEGIRRLWARSIMHLLGHSFGIENQFLVKNDPTDPNGENAEDFYYSGWPDFRGLQYAPGNGSVSIVEDIYPFVDGSGMSAAGGADAHIHTEGSSDYHGGSFSPFGVQGDPDLDGIPESQDNCAGFFNPNQANADGDFFGDVCDADDDNDGVPDDFDPYPLDTDNDSTDNNNDDDDDGDGVVDTADNCPLSANAAQEDADADSAGDACDSDDDDDSYPDWTEFTTGSDSLNSSSQPEIVGNDNSCADGLDNDLDGFVDGNDEGCLDADGDTVPDYLDLCPTMFENGMPDNDHDGLGDACDDDDDDDGIADTADLCARTAAGAAVDANGCSDVEVDRDGDGICDGIAESDGPAMCTGADLCPHHPDPGQEDSDDDNWGDACDNCPSLSNPTQFDSDQDGIGDDCETDTDGDGVPDSSDNCVFETAQEDSDGDGVGDACDNCPGVSNAGQEQSDSDVLGDACDNCPTQYNADQADLDGDGAGEVCDVCPTDVDPAQVDSDDDGIGDACDNCIDTYNPGQADTDQDGTGDACDATPIPQCAGLQATIVGTNGPDTLTGTSEMDVIHGLDGNDTINGLGGNDILCGGDGDDTIDGSSEKDLCDGGPGGNSITSCEPVLVQDLAIDGSALTVTVGAPGQVVLVRFSGSSGQHIGLGMTDSSFTSSCPRVSLHSPAGQKLEFDTCVLSGNEDLDASLTMTGTYSIFVDQGGSATGDLTLTLSEDLIYPISIDGSPANVNITRPGQNARAVFTGSPGQGVGVGVLGSDFGSCGLEYIYVLKRPSGSDLVSVCPSQGTADLDVKLPATGAYSVWVDPRSARTGVATVIVSEDVTVAGSLDGPPVPITITRQGQNGRVLFEGVAGDQVGVGLTDSAFAVCPDASIVDDGEATISSENCVSVGKDLDGQLSSDGTYAVLVDPNGVQTGSITVTLSADIDGGTITVDGSPVTVSVSRPGQNVRVSFNGVAGQQLGLGYTNLTFAECPGGKIYDPGGATAVTDSCLDTDGDDADLTLSSGGQHTIWIDNTNQNGGNITLTLSQDQSAGEIIVNGDPVLVSIARPGQNQWLTFTGSPGQQLGLGLSNISVPACPAVQIYEPSGGSPLSSNACVGLSGGEMDLELVEVGIHSILADSSRSAIGSFTLTLSTDKVIAATVGGSSVFVNITRAGQNARVTFDATQGQFLGVGLTAGTFGTCPPALLFEPSGSAVDGACVNDSGGELDEEAEETGTYTAFLDPNGSTTGSFSFTVSQDLMTVMRIGSPGRGVASSRPGQNVRIRFEGQAGQQLLGLGLSEPGITVPCGSVVRVYNPDGSDLSSSTCVSSGEELDLNLPSSGTYTIAIDNVDAQVGHLRVDLSEDSFRSLIGGPSVTAQIDRPGRNVRIALHASAGQQVSFLMNPTGGLGACLANVYLYSPSGSLVHQDSCPTPNELFTATPTVDGLHEIVVESVNHEVGTMQLTLQGGQPICGVIPPVLPDGSLYRGDLSGTVFVIYQSTKYPIRDIAGLGSVGLDALDIECVSDSSLDPVQASPADDWVLTDAGTLASFAVQCGGLFGIPDGATKADLLGNGYTNTDLPTGIISVLDLDFAPADYCNLREAAGGTEYVVCSSPGSTKWVIPTNTTPPEYVRDRLLSSLYEGGSPPERVLWVGALSGYSLLGTLMCFDQDPPVFAGDIAGDGFDDIGEGNFLPTLGNEACPQTGTANDESIDAWPTDYDDNQAYNITDVLAAKPAFGSVAGDGLYNPRFDLTFDGRINISDVVAPKQWFGFACANHPIP